MISGGGTGIGAGLGASVVTAGGVGLGGNGGRDAIGLWPMGAGPPGFLCIKSMRVAIFKTAAIGLPS